MIVLILCAGNQARFDEDFARPAQPKQLLPVHGMPLLHRTIDQVRDAGHDPIVITHKHEISASLFIMQPPWPRWTMPKYHDKISDTLWSTKSLWQKRTAVLLGDVYYTPDSLHSILSFDGKIAFFGDSAEIFGLSFTPHRLLDHAITAARSHSRGKLWEVYRSYDSIPLDQHTIDLNRTFRYVDDGTADVDTWEEYQQLLRRIA